MDNHIFLGSIMITYNVSFFCSYWALFNQLNKVIGTKLTPFSNPYTSNLIDQLTYLEKKLLN